jgi:hypothetical protein
LQSTIFKAKNEDELAKRCINKITLPREQHDSYGINKKVLIRVLNGSLLDYESIERAKNKTNEYDGRMSHLFKLMFIRELCGGTEFSVDRANREIQENIDRLKILIEL